MLTDEALLAFVLDYFPFSVPVHSLATRNGPFRIVEPFHGYIDPETRSLVGLERLKQQDYFLFHFHGRNRKNKMLDFYRGISSLDLDWTKWETSNASRQRKTDISPSSVEETQIPAVPDGLANLLVL